MNHYYTSLALLFTSYCISRNFCIISLNNGCEAPASCFPKPLPGNQPLAEALQRNATALFKEPIPACGTPLYTDVRIFGEAGIPGVLYGAGPRTVLESHAKRADERLDLEDLRRATKVIARSLHDLLS
jgi:succinyl-diaminopimelate desuccinylase